MPMSMYDFEFLNQRLHIAIRGEPVVEGIVPSVTLDDGTVITPSPATGESDAGEDRLGPYTDHRFVYQDEGAHLMVTLTFRVYAEVMVASAAVTSLQEDQIGVRPRGLAPFGGLTLSVAGLGDVTGLMANYLHKDWWTRPYFDTDLTTMPPRTQSIVWQAGGRYHHLLCVADDLFKTEVAGDEDGCKVLVGAYDGGYTNVKMVLFALASGEDPFALPHLNVAAGMEALGKPFQMRMHKRYPEAFEYLGWCSWDAFYHEVNAEGILAKAREFHEKEVPVRWFIIDDGWLSNVDAHLTAFEPDPDKFPGGLVPLIDALKGTYDLWWLGVWHTLFGYWHGIHPDSALATAMAPTLTMTHHGKVVPAPDLAKGFGFWNAWHTYLLHAGVDFVKVDYQSGLATYWQHEMAIGAAAQVAHEALEASVGKNFDNTMINCMGMATENLWHRPTSSVTRNSDDFFPKQEGSFVEHALQNAYNAYYHSPFMWLDWDMWWTRHENAATHAILRAVSGGPIYVSDRVGATNPHQLWPLILSDGRLLRCDVPGQVTADCLLQDPSWTGLPLKIWSRAGEAGVIAAVHVSTDPEQEVVEGVVRAGDVPDMRGERFVVYEHFGQRAWVVDAAEEIPMEVRRNKAALFLILPLAEHHTPIGLVDKYIAPAAIADWFATEEKTTVVLFDGGCFAWSAESTPREVRVNGELTEVTAGDGIFTVDCSDRRGSIWIEIYV